MYTYCIMHHRKFDILFRVLQSCRTSVYVRGLWCASSDCRSVQMLKRKWFVFSLTRRQNKGDKLTSQASARANPPPSSRMTLHGIRLLTVGQSSSGGDGPTGLLRSTTTQRHPHCWWEMHRHGNVSRSTQPFFLNWWINRVPVGHGRGKGKRHCVCWVAGNSVWCRMACRLPQRCGCF